MAEPPLLSLPPPHVFNCANKDKLFDKEQKAVLYWLTTDEYLSNNESATVVEVDNCRFLVCQPSVSATKSDATSGAGATDADSVTDNSLFTRQGIRERDSKEEK